MDKRDAGLFRDNWGCTCPSSDRLQTFNGTTDVDGLDTEEGGMLQLRAYTLQTYWRSLFACV